jgi:hypothetical protein
MRREADVLRVCAAGQMAGVFAHVIRDCPSRGVRASYGRSHRLLCTAMRCLFNLILDTAKTRCVLTYKDGGVQCRFTTFAALGMAPAIGITLVFCFLM